MFNVGGGEFIVIALIALIVLGPQRLPDAARQVGKVMGDLKRLSSGFQDEMKSAFADADKPTQGPVPDDGSMISAVEAVSDRPAAEDVVPKADPPPTTA